MPLGGGPSTANLFGGEEGGSGERRKWLNPSTMSLDTGDYRGDFAGSRDDMDGSSQDPFRDDVKDVKDEGGRH